MATRILLSIVCAAALLVAQRGPLDPAWDLLAKGERGKAVEFLQRFLAANPSDGEAHLMLGSIFVEDGNGAEALAQLSEAARLMPRSAMAHNAFGEALNHAGKADAARGEFERAVAADDGFAQAHVNLGLALLAANEAEAAAKHLDRAVAILGRDPESAYPRYLRAKIYTDENEPGKAAAELKEAVALRPDFAEAWSDLGQARKSLLDDEGAFDAFRRSVDLAPDNAVSQYRLGAEYLRKGQAHDAVTHLREAFRLNPESQATLYVLQRALRADGQPEEAARVKQKLAEALRKIDRDSQTAFTALRLNNEGAALERNGDLRGALEKYRAARGLDPDHEGIRVNFAVALLRLGQWKEGLAELRDAVRRNPNDARLKAALADALEQAPVEFGGRKK